MATFQKFTNRPVKSISLNDTLTSGITKSDSTKKISELLDFYSNGDMCRAYIRVNTLKKTIPSDAALAFGEHIASFPAGTGIVVPVFAHVKLTSLCPTGLSATAGEVGLGSLIGSGANADLGSVGETAENIMGGTTLSNHVAATTLISEKANVPGDITYSATQPASILDASSSAVKIHLNLASTWNQTATEVFTFGADIVLDFRVVGSDFGVLA